MGLSTATLYQRFGTKDDLFLAALSPPPPDLGAWPDARDADDGLDFLIALSDAAAAWFDEVLPAALRLIAHPTLSTAFLQGDHDDLRSVLTAAVAERIAALAERGLVDRAASPPDVADLVVSIAHDAVAVRALAAAGGHDPATLRKRIRLLWRGLRP